MSVSISCEPSGPAIGAHLVPSSTGHGNYTVRVAFDGALRCNCADFCRRNASKRPTVNSPRSHYCKHCWSVIADTLPVWARDGKPVNVWFPQFDQAPTGQAASTGADR